MFFDAAIKNRLVAIAPNLPRIGLIVLINLIGRYLGIPGVILILLSFGHSLRKRGMIKSDNPIRLLRLHEWLAWIDSTSVRWRMRSMKRVTAASTTSLR